MQEFIIAMENKTGEMCFYYLFTFMGHYYVKEKKKEVMEKFILAFIYALFVDNTWLFMIGSFIVLVSKERRNQLGQVPLAVV